METRCSLAGRKLHILILAATCGVIQTPLCVAATPITWWVTNQGLDSPSCGARAKPCRSISAAIEKAADGDSIVVGAGLYGDLNGDGKFTAPGEEKLGMSLEGHSCIVCISKSIKLSSLHGAERTIIDAGNSGRADPNSVPRVDDVVNISFTGGVTLGNIDGGFTITGGGGNGVHVEPTADAKIIDNIARGNVAVGFRVDVADISAPPFPVPVTKYTLQGNVAIGNRIGFSVNHDETRDIPELVSLTGNNASGNADTGYSLPAVGIQLQMIGNFANNNGTGIFVAGNDFEIRNNSVFGNAGPGILINGVIGGLRLAITGNSIIGNRGAGVFILIGDTSDYISRNNIYGNFGAVQPPIGLSLPSTLNCGIVNAGFPGQGPSSAIDATDNYWGSPNGPGPDPADNAGKACDFNGGTTVVKPFATALFGFSP